MERITRRFARELIERESVDVIQPDTGRAGGLSQMKKIAAMAEARSFEVRVVPQLHKALGLP